jgi:hypothetical protein
MAQALFTIARLLHLTHLRLTLAHLNSPNMADKAALLTFPNRNRFRESEDSGQTTSCSCPGALECRRAEMQTQGCDALCRCRVHVIASNRVPVTFSMRGMFFHEALQSAKHTAHPWLEISCFLGNVEMNAQ